MAKREKSAQEASFDEKLKKKNVGNILEGIFAIAAALYFVDGRVDKDRLNHYRILLDPRQYEHKRLKLTVFGSINVGTMSFVDVQIKMPRAVTEIAYGDDYKNHFYDHGLEVPGLDKKIDTLISKFSGSELSVKFREAKKKLLTAAEKETKKRNAVTDVHIRIIADGEEGAQKGGKIKGDVFVDFLKLEAVADGKAIAEETLSVSLKGDSKTLANLSPHKGLMDFAAHFGVNKSTNVQKFYDENLGVFTGDASTPQQKLEKVAALKELFERIVGEIERSTVGPRFTEKSISFLHVHAFGDDMAHVLAIENKQLKETSPEIVKQIMQKFKLDVTVRKTAGTSYLVFHIKGSPTQIIYHLRLKLRESERKLMIEAGSMIVRKVA